MKHALQSVSVELSVCARIDGEAGVPDEEHWVPAVAGKAVLLVVAVTKLGPLLNEQVTWQSITLEISISYMSSYMIYCTTRVKLIFNSHESFWGVPILAAMQCQVNT